MWRPTRFCQISSFLVYLSTSHKKVYHFPQILLARSLPKAQHNDSNHCRYQVPRCIHSDGNQGTQSHHWSLRGIGKGRHHHYPPLPHDCQRDIDWFEVGSCLVFCKVSIVILEVWEVSFTNLIERTSTLIQIGSAVFCHNTRNDGKESRSDGVWLHVEDCCDNISETSDEDSVEGFVEDKCWSDPLLYFIDLWLRTI